MPSPRAARVGDQIRDEITSMLVRDVHDPGIGFVTITSVKVTADLQHARVYYTTLGDEKARRESGRALERATPFLRRQVAGRLRLRRAPELQFFFDVSVERHDRVEQILQELAVERASNPIIEDPPAQAQAQAVAPPAGVDGDQGEHPPVATDSVADDDARRDSH